MVHLSFVESRCGSECEPEPLESLLILFASFNHGAGTQVPALRDLDGILAGKYGGGLDGAA